MYLRSKDAARMLGMHPNTLRKLANEGKIHHIKTESGQRRYDVSSFIGESKPETTVCYCRVSSYKQKDDLERQTNYLKSIYENAEFIRDIGSGLNFKRKGLNKILERAMRGDKLRLVVAHRDRLARFGFDLIRFVIERNGGSIVVLNETSLSPDEELVKDLLNILHVFSCRVHGLRSYKNQIGKNLSDITAEKNI